MYVCMYVCMSIPQLIPVQSLTFSVAYVLKRAPTQVQIVRALSCTKTKVVSKCMHVDAFFFPFIHI